MAKKKTHEEFVQELAEVNPDIEVLGVYKNSKTKLLVKCKIDGYEWEARADNLLQKQGCPKCRCKKISKKLAKEHEEFEKKYRQKFPDRNYIIFLTEYISVREKILCYSFIDNDYWWMSPENLNSGQGNPFTRHERSRIARAKPHEDYKAECLLLGLEPIEKYYNNQTPIMHRCLECGTEFYAQPNNIKTGNTGCPHCNKSKSKAEWAITDILDSNNINFNPEYTVNINDHLLRYDFWLPDYNCFIEYDGKQHFESIEHWGGESQLEQRQLYDKWKDEYCEQNNINLLRIKYTTPMEEFENIIFNFIKEAV